MPKRMKMIIAWTGQCAGSYDRGQGTASTWGICPISRADPDSQSVNSIIERVKYVINTDWGLKTELKI